jgi:hypothetical protein
MNLFGVRSDARLTLIDGRRGLLWIQWQGETHVIELHDGQSLHSWGYFCDSIHSVKTIITLNDGSIYSSPEATENLRVDDTILIVSGRTSDRR